MNARISASLGGFEYVSFRETDKLQAANETYLKSGRDEKDAKDRLNQSEARFVTAFYIGMRGEMRHMLYPVGKYATNKTADGSSFGMMKQENSDVHLEFDHRSLRITPRIHGDPMGIVMATVKQPDGSNHPCDMRGKLIESVARTETEYGVTPYMAIEREIGLYAGPSAIQNFGSGSALEYGEQNRYCDMPIGSRGTEFLKRLTEALRGSGIDVEKAHAEVNAGQIEINVAPANAVMASDMAKLIPIYAEAIADDMGMTASIITKYGEGNANAAHVNFSLMFVETPEGQNSNLFYDKGRPDELSRIGELYCVGIARRGRIIAALGANTTNSTERFDPKREAPVNLHLDYASRKALVRGSRTRYMDNPGAGAKRGEWRGAPADMPVDLVCYTLHEAGMETAGPAIKGERTEEQERLIGGYGPACTPSQIVTTMEGTLEVLRTDEGGWLKGKMGPDAYRRFVDSVEEDARLVGPQLGDGKVTPEGIIYHHFRVTQEERLEREAELATKAESDEHTDDESAATE